MRQRLTAAEAAHSAGITEEEAVPSLERDPAPGLFEAQAAGADGLRIYCLRNRVGILAYGSLHADPGPGLTPYVERRITLTTPFPVEYVRSSPTRRARRYWCRCRQATARQAPAKVLVLTPEVVDRETAGVLLQRRKLDQASDDDMWFAADAEEMAVRELPGFAGLPVVLCASRRAEPAGGDPRRHPGG